MRLVVQRVKRASITIEDQPPKHMDQGLVVLFAASVCDTKDATDGLIEKLASKTANLRIFSDELGKMNLSALELNLSVMIVSQFTLYADTNKGNRPSFIEAAGVPEAETIYDKYVDIMRSYGFREFLTGEFGARMSVELVNDGPVTIIIDTKEWETKH